MEISYLLMMKAIVNNDLGDLNTPSDIEKELKEYETMYDIPEEKVHNPLEDPKEIREAYLDMK
jgi:hypothetical protein